MKNNIILSVLCLLFVTQSCKKALKEVEDYYPTVETTKIEYLPDNKIKVTGKIISNGYSDLTDLGFCYDITQDAKMHKNQLSVNEFTKEKTNFDGETFTGIYENFNSATANVYFRTWAVNQNGYSYGNSIALNSLVSPSVTVPCNITENTYNFGQGVRTVSSVILSLQFDKTIIYASGDFGSFEISFKNPLSTGIYKTESFSGGNFCRIQFTNFNSFTINDGFNVYVNEESDFYSIVCCNATYNVSSSSTGNFNFKIKVVK